MRCETRRAPSKKRLEHLWNGRERNVGGQIAMRDASFPMFRRRWLLAIVVVVVSVIDVVPVVMLLERFVEYHVRERHDIEAEQPKCTTERRPMWTPSRHPPSVAFRSPLGELAPKPERVSSRCKGDMGAENNTNQVAICTRPGFHSISGR